MTLYEAHNVMVVDKCRGDSSSVIKYTSKCRPHVSWHIRRGRDFIRKNKHLVDKNTTKIGKINTKKRQPYGYYFCSNRA